MAAGFGYRGTNGEYKTIEHHDFWLVWGESRKKKTKLKDFNSQFSTKTVRKSVWSLYRSSKAEQSELRPGLLCKVNLQLGRPSMLRQRVLQRLGRLRQEIFYIDKDEMVDPSDSSEQSLPVDAVMFLLK